ncbi:MAG: hypothetical protein ACREEE_05055, partial [Dongiaceae bacterium]
MNDQDQENAAAPNPSASAAKSAPAARNADEIADHLAVCAVMPAIAAGAADPEAGPAVCTDLLAHELASSHNVLMRFAIAANTVMDWPATKAQIGDPAPSAPNATAVDLAGARCAASAGRVLDCVRLALVAWRARRPAAVEDERWEGLAWTGFECNDAEVKRKLDAAKAAKAARDAAEGRGEPQMSAGGRRLRRAAVAQSALLAEEAEAAVLADRVAGPGGALFMRRLFGHELAAIHGLKMRLDGGAVRALDRAVELAVDPVAACRLAEAAARAGDRYRRGLAAMERYDKGPNGEPRHPNIFWLGPDGGYEPPGPDQFDANAPTAAMPELDPAARAGDRPRFYATDPALRRGRLNNGNPAGDFRAAPRCGAGTRHGGDCRQPAMA